MIDTDKYESMRRLFLDFIESASDEVDEEAWRNKLTMLDELLAEVKRLQKEVDQLSIDVCESLELILDAYHPEVKDSVMSMFGDAIGNNWPYYGTLE